MFEAFFPDAYVRSTFRIDYKKYYGRGYRGIIFDIDNTLVEHDAPADQRAIRLVRYLKKMGYKVVIVSNNHEPRVKSFAEAVDCFYVYEADKPLKKGYLEGVKKMGLRRDQVLVIGDQFFTDIWGAKRCGLECILVGKVAFHEPPHVHLKRLLEWPIRQAYFKKRRKERNSR